MTTTIEVNKQSVKDFLGSGKSKPFIIPEYQRPYAWTDEQAETLFEDLWEFAATSGGTERDSSYFLGSVVAYENENDEQEIIDGQQRITSLFLLLRAIYTKLCDIPESEREKKANNFIDKIGATIWNTDKLTGEIDYRSVLLTSRVVSDDRNEVLRNILETGEIEDDAIDNYSKNYRCFQELYDSHSKENAFMMYQFIYALLNQAILLPITADSQDTALTIFSTLNDRGLPLSDSDIFKAKIYNHLDSQEKDEFIEKWKDLDEQAIDAGESIQQLFYYNMFYYRATEHDTKATTPGLRKYYIENANKCLYDTNLLDTLVNVLNLWKVINKNEELENENWTRNIKIKQILDILISYPNEFWKYPVVVYYVCHKNEENFESNFEIFLKKLAKELITKYLMVPTISAVKHSILKLNNEVIDSSIPKFDFKTDIENLEDYIKKPNRNIVRMLLKMLAYEHQNYLLPERWEIEHIFPQKWQDAYFTKEQEEDVKIKIEHLGNKLPIEKKLNIIAGNGYFDKKKQEYKKSEILITKEMGESNKLDWGLDSIIERDVYVSNEIRKILDKWDNEYLRTYAGNNETDVPSEEDLARIKDYKKKGWI